MDLADTGTAETFTSDLQAWSSGNIRSFPWRGPDVTPYEVLVAEIFLKQTRSSTVASVLPEFLEEFPSPEALQAAEREEIMDIIKPLGLYRDRSQALEQIGNRLSGASVPRTEKELMELPQVGRYVANATLCFGFKEPKPILDSNIRRIYSRLFHDHGLASLGDDELWRFAEAMLPEDDVVAEYNMALLDFGADICMDSSPRCEVCFASSYCDYYQNQDDLSEE